MSGVRFNRRQILGLAAILATLPPSIASAQILPRRRLTLIPRRAHPWGRFMPGAWRTVKTETIVLGRDGSELERTLSEATTEFVTHDSSKCTLRVESCTVIPGSEVVSAPKVVTLPFDPEGEIEVKKLDDEYVTVQGMKHKVEVRQAKLVEKSGEKIMTVHLTKDEDPRILKRETKLLQPKSDDVQAVTRTQVVKLDIEREVAGENRKTREVRTIHTHSAGKVETTEYLCDDVPGEMVYQESKEFDAVGKLTRRSTVELTDFGKDNDGRRRLFGRRDREHKKRNF